MKRGNKHHPELAGLPSLTPDHGRIGEGLHDHWLAAIQPRGGAGGPGE